MRTQRVVTGWSSTTSTVPPVSVAPSLTVVHAFPSGDTSMRKRVA
jgi:hypothetical protein